HALVVYGQDRMDEVSASAPTTVCELRDGFYRTTTIAPEDFGEDPAAVEPAAGLARPSIMQKRRLLGRRQEEGL
ncbi:MAG: hypothetical protein IJG13_09930, partial [Kiritimatiellae bacterium]|nr:hypothetical protein [Kiritimatiellia bacterium]